MKAPTYISGFCNTESQASYDAHAKCTGSITTPSGTYMCKCPNHANDIPKQPTDVCLECRAEYHERCEEAENKFCRCYQEGHDPS